MTVSIS